MTTRKTSLTEPHQICAPIYWNIRIFFTKKDTSQFESNTRYIIQAQFPDKLLNHRLVNSLEPVIILWQAH